MNEVVNNTLIVVVVFVVDANENNASGHKPIDVARRYANFQNIDVFEFAHENPDRFRTLFKQNNNEEGFTP